jgi:dephospho-CoA kinase
MIIIGLTGSIGMGKSFVLEQFANKKIRTFDYDKAVRQLYNKPEFIKVLKKHFPESFNQDEFDKKILSQIVFSDRQKLLQLEKIIYPLAHKACLEFIISSRKAGQKMVVIEIPLLYEKGLAKFCDLVILASCSNFMQENRVMKRPGMTKELFNLVRINQMSDIKKRNRADRIIYTGVGKAITYSNIQDVIKHAHNNLRHRNYRPRSKQWA